MEGAQLSSDRLLVMRNLFIPLYVSLQEITNYEIVMLSVMCHGGLWCVFDLKAHVHQKHCDGSLNNNDMTLYTMAILDD